MSNLEENKLDEGLIVPIHVDAFCVGSREKEQLLMQNSFSGPTSDAPSDDTLFWSTLAIPFSETSKAPLQSGVHLHWALPDALTSGKINAEGQLTFPPVPNRWLVTRLNLKDMKVSNKKSWVIESDYVHPNEPKKSNPTVLRNIKVGQGPPVAFLGRCQELENFQEDRARGLENLMGQPLTAVTSGVPYFAAYYPDCRSVFGFHDPLDSITKADLMYGVIGWFSNIKNDPIANRNPDTDLAQSLKEFRWALSDTSSATFSMYSGSVQGIQWDKNQRYTNEEGDLTPIQAELALGNHKEEALSAYLHGKESAKSDFFEQVLLAPESESHDFILSSPDLFAKLLEDSHKKEFSSQSGGIVHQIAPKDQNQQEEKTKDLPLAIVEKLHSLNQIQLECHYFSDSIQSLQSQLYADWRRIHYPNPKATETARDRKEQIQTLRAPFKEKTDLLHSSIQTLNRAISNEYLLTQTPAQRYTQPNEPVVAIIGKGEEATSNLQYPLRYGGDGRYGKPNTPFEDCLLCRKTSQISDRMSIKNKLIPVVEIPFSSNEKKNLEKYLPFQLFEKLLQEMCFYNVKYLQGFFPGIDFSYLLAFLEKNDPTVIGVNQSPPSLIGLQYWKKNPWLPLFLIWEVWLYPYHKTLEQGKIKEYQKEFVQKHFALDQKEGRYFHPKKAPECSFSDIQFYDFFTPLSPLPKKKLDKAPKNTLVQPLAGLNNALLMRHETLQVHPSSLSSGINLSEAVGDKTGLGVDFARQFNPLRAGFLEIVNLELVDVFGKKRKIEFEPTEISYSQSLSTKGSKERNMAFLPPRITQPSRLLFQWKGDDQLNPGELHGNSDPSAICGWLVPNHLEKGLFLYTAEGKAIACMQFNQREKKYSLLPFPGSKSTTVEEVHRELDCVSPILKEYIKYLSTTSASNVDSILGAMEKRSSSILSPLESSQAHTAILIGAPIALVQAALRLDLKGLPSLNQREECYLDGYTPSSNEFEKVEFPLLLGDMSRKDDGLVGFYQKSSGGYNYSLFHHAWQSNSSTPLTLTPSFYEFSGAKGSIEKPKSLLMLVDPKAPVHASMGILPTQALQLPNTWIEEALQKLEMAFFASPLLTEGNEIRLPTPKEEGYTFSWVGRSKDKKWEIPREILPETQESFATNKNTRLREGWLRFNPSLLEFSLLSQQEQPILKNGETICLQITNTTKIPLELVAGPSAEEGKSPTSCFYMHFGRSVDLPKIKSNSEWEIQSYESPLYGKYFGFSPKQGRKPTLLPKATLSWTLGPIQLLKPEKTSQLRVFFNYYNIEGIDNGTYKLSINTKR